MIDNTLLRLEKFKDISLNDPFFDSLKADYREFSAWFLKKGDHEALTFRSESGRIEGFLYLKEESGPVPDTAPPLPPAHRIKIGTFKINPHGTRLGERFIKKAFDRAVASEAQSLYVTVFEKHQALMGLFYEYGFVVVAEKRTANGVELVLERRLDQVVGDVVRDYPRIPITRDRHFVLAVYPEWHSRLLPDSLLKTESASILSDVSHTNSIHKIYLTAMSGVEQLRAGDTLLIYRTQDGGPARYTSVVTSLCVVEGVRHIDTFHSEQDFVTFCNPYSVFEPNELRGFYRKRKFPWLIGFTYNMALTKRINRDALISKVGLPENTYWGFFQVSTDQLKEVLRLSGDYEKARSLVYTPRVC